MSAQLGRVYAKLDADAGKRAGPRPIVKRMSDVDPEPISWLWPGRIALGKLTLLAGDPGLGKSLVSIALATHVSRGSDWPVGRTLCPQGDVLMLSAEDDPGDTIRPRLDAAGADPGRVHILTAIEEHADGELRRRIISLRRDLASLKKALDDLPECKLVIVDPITAYLDGADSHNNAEVRGLFAPLADLAARCHVAVVAVTHLNKSGQGNAMYRTTGSLAFVAAARAVFLVTKDKDDRARRLVLPSKNNLAADSSGVAYGIIEAQNGAPTLAWEPDPVEITADEALDNANQDHGDARDEAREWLKDTLKDGAFDGKTLKDMARDAGIAERTLYRASKELGVKTESQGFGKARLWAMPAMSAKSLLRGTIGTLEDSGKHDDSMSAKNPMSANDGHTGSLGTSDGDGRCPRCDGEGCAWCR